MVVLDSASEAVRKNDQKTEGVDPDSEEMQPILNNLQANILKAHGRDEAYHLFLRFTGDINRVKAWIRQYAANPHQVTSAAQQIQDAKKLRLSKKKKDVPVYTAGLLGCFFLSVAGYKFLDFPTDQFENSFRRGLQFHDKDTQLENWQDDYKKGEIHAMLLLAQNRNEPGPTLSDTVNQIKESLEGIATVVAEELGARRVNDKGQDLEHFGYRDGISNPLFFKDEIQRNRGNWYDPSAPLELVLAKDPFAGDDYGYGSYFVFQKFEQDVKAFNNRVEELARNVNQGNVDLTGAQVIGRFKNGTPVTDADIPHDSSSINDFNYDDDSGFRCPHHAHIRKVNLRNDRGQSRRVVRRGIPYGQEDDAEVGLLFMCYQSSIHDQFEFIRQFWVDNPDHPVAETGNDPLIGHVNTPVAQQQWPITYNTSEAGKRAFNFGAHVILRGEEYFFAPSLSFLKGEKMVEVEKIKVMFTVTCATHSCPRDKKLNEFRVLSAASADSQPEVQQALATAREAVVSNIRERDPRLNELAHYRMELYDGSGNMVEMGRDVFVGLADIDSFILSRNGEGKLQIVEPEGRQYLNAMFRSFFRDLNDPEDNDFSWLTWVIVPLVEALEGRFNPIGMGGSGR